MELRWETPPPVSRSKGRPLLYVAEGEAVRANPGRRPLLDTRPTAQKANAAASHIRRCKGYSTLHGCEAVVRTVDGEHRIYVRWPEKP